MDKRIILGLALAGSVAIGAFLSGDSADDVHGSYRGAHYPQGGSYTGANSKEQTFKLLVRDEDEPNTAAVTEGWIQADGYYDQINESTDAEDFMRWCYLSASSRTTPFFNSGLGPVSGRANAEDHTTPPTRFGLMAFKVTGLKSGHRVESAHLAINWQHFSSNVDLSTGYVTARLDTNIQDYVAVATTSPEAGDLTFMDSSYDYADVGKTVAWTVDMDDRGDMHDWGPMGVPLYPADSDVDAGDPFLLDVGPAVQQALDTGLLEKTDGWLMFAVYQVGTPTTSAFWAHSQNSSYTPYGNPALVVETNNRRGIAPWNDGEIPIIFTFDDAYLDHVDYLYELKPYGLKLTEVPHLDGLAVRIATFDTMITNNADHIDFLAHSRDHTSLGSLTGSPLDFELERTWWDSLLTTPPDTNTGLNHYAWPGHTATPKRSIEAIERMVDFGYESCRATYPKWEEDGATAFGWSGFLSWDNPVNMFAIGSPNGNLIFDDTGSPAAIAYIKEALADFVDDLYNNHGKAAVIFYIHNETTDKVNAANLAAALNHIDITPGIKNANYLDMISIRDRGRVPPYMIADLDIQGEDSTSIKASAAMHDSLINLVGGHDQMRQVWCTGVGEAIPPMAPKIEFDFPVFAHWGYRHEVYTPQTSFAQDHVDSIGTLDYIHFPQEFIDNDFTEWVGMTGRVRTVNPDIIIVNYIRMFGVAPTWRDRPEGDFFYELTKIVERNSDGHFSTGGGSDIDFYMYTVDGDTAWHYGSNPPVAMINPMAPGIVDTFANFYIDRLKQNDNFAHHVGFFVDWVFHEYPGWPFENGDTTRDSLDMNEDGTMYGSDATEDEAYVEFVNTMAPKFRKAAGREDFIMIANGNTAVRSEIGWNWDGAMIENFHTIANPNDKTEWTNVITNASDGYSDERVSPPMLMFQAEHDSVGPVTEALGTLARGIATAVESHSTSHRESFTIFARQFKIGQMEAGTLSITGTDPLEVVATYIDDAGIRSRVECKVPIGSFGLPIAYNITVDIDGIPVVIATGGGW